MTTDLDIRPDLSNSDTDEGASHIVCCCSVNIALCGKDVSHENIIEWGDWDDCDGCKRCLELEESACILCGWDASKNCYCGKCWR